MSFPKEIKKAPSTREVALFKAQYNALVQAIAPKPLGAGVKLEEGAWYFCPESMNIFSFSHTQGGWKHGTVVFDLDLTPEATSAKSDIALEDTRASPGDGYRLKSVKIADYHAVDKDSFEATFRTLAPGAVRFHESFPTLFNAIAGSTMTTAQLRKEGNKEFQDDVKATCGGKLSRDELVVALLLTAAKRHVGNKKRMELEALEMICRGDARDRLQASEEACLDEWQRMVTAYVDVKEEGAVEKEAVEEVEKGAAASSAAAVIDLTASTPSPKGKFGGAGAVRPSAPTKLKPVNKSLANDLAAAAATASSAADAGFTTPVKAGNMHRKKEDAGGSPFVGFAVAAAVVGAAAVAAWG